MRWDRDDDLVANGAIRSELRSVGAIGWALPSNASPKQLASVKTADASGTMTRTVHDASGCCETGSVYRRRRSPGCVPPDRNIQIERDAVGAAARGVSPDAGGGGGLIDRRRCRRCSCRRRCISR